MKRRSLFLVAFATLMLFSFEGYSQSSIQTGQFNFDRNDPGSKLSQGKIGNKAAGNRSVTKEVKFRRPFATIPNVLISINNLDARTDERSLRCKVEPKFVTKDGFVIEASTWSDSEVLTIGGTWMAISEN